MSFLGDTFALSNAQRLFLANKKKIGEFMDKVKLLSGYNAKRPSKMKLLHIVPSGAIWAVRADSVSRARKLCSSVDAALEYTAQYQHKGWAVAVHKDNGMVDYMLDKDGNRL